MTAVGDLLTEVNERLGGNVEPDVLTLTEKNGFVRQAERFNKRLATADTSNYKVIYRNEIAFNPYLLWAGALAQNTICEVGVISPLYPTFRVRNGYDPRYVARLLLTPQMISAYDGIAFGSVPRRRRSSVRDFMALPLPEQPPLEEQRRIAEILDQADALRAKRRQALALLDGLTQSIFIDMFGDPVANPMGLAQKSLLDVCTPVSGGTPSKNRPELWQGSLPWFSPKDMKRRDLFDSQDHVSDSIAEHTSMRVVPADTVAIVVRGMILAHTVPVCMLRVASVINQDMKALLPTVDIEPEFLLESLRAQHRHILATVDTAAHGTKRLDSRALSQIRVPIVPVADQRAFVRRTARVRGLWASMEAAVQHDSRLLASLHGRAFSGRL